MMNFCLPTLALTLALPLQDASDESTYRQLFQEGVAALNAGDRSGAVALFDAAGARAPGASIWRAYAKAAGEESRQDEGLVPTPEPKVSMGKWSPVAVDAPGYANEEISSTGRRILLSAAEAELVDVDTGGLVARLSSRIPEASSIHDGIWWSFDVSGRVVVGREGLHGAGVGIDLRDAKTGRPIEAQGAFALDITPGARYEWFAQGEKLPECAYPETVDLPSGEGVLRCHFVRDAEQGNDFHSKRFQTQLSRDGGLAILRSGSVPTTLKVVDRRTGDVLLEQSPAGHSSLFSPGAKRVFVVDNDKLECVDLESKTSLWSVERKPQISMMTRPALTFLGQQLVEISLTGKVVGFDADTGERSELFELRPAPNGPLDGALFVQGGALLVVLCTDSTCCYRTTTGERLWSKGAGRWFTDPAEGTVDAAETLCLIKDEAGEVQAVELATGEPYGERSEPPRGLSSLVAVDGGTAAIVALESGEVRRVDLSDGGTTATATDLVRPGGRAGLLAKGEGILAVTSDGEARLLDSASLATLAGTRIGKDDRFSAFSPDGRFCVATQKEPRETRLIQMDDDLAGEVLWEDDQAFYTAAFSPSGDLLALAGDGRLVILDGRSGEVRLDRELLPGKRFGKAAFHGEAELIVGMSAQQAGAPYGAWVVDAEVGTVIGQMNSSDAFGGGTIMHVYSDVEAGLVILTAATGGTVEAFSDDDWSSIYSLPTSGGNWGTIVVRHEDGSSVAAVSGMSSSKSRVFDLKSGRIESGDKLQGMYGLAVVNDAKRIIGIKDARLTVLDAKTYKTLYTREEGPGGSAWITRDGVRSTAPGPAPPSVDPVHLIHDGWSAPIDSFDAWLYDPMDLVKPSVRTLPELPVILSVAPASGTAPEDGPNTERLEIIASSNEPILGAELRWSNGQMTFVEAASSRSIDDEPGDKGRKLVALKQTPEGWTSLRLVARSGVLSRPHFPAR